MQKWRCSICDYIYTARKGDPESGIKPGTRFEDLPEYWGCPDCGASKQNFERMADDGLDY